LNAFAALCRREWQESRTPYLMAILGLIAVVAFTGVITSLFATMNGASVVTVVESSDQYGNTERHERITDQFTDFVNFANWTDAELRQRLSTVRLLVSSMFHVVFFGVVIFVLLGCVYDQRKDRSVLFWKSMPVTDAMTIASKLITPVWLVPLLVVAAISVSWLLLLSLLSAITISEELGSVARLWANSQLLSGILSELLGYTIQGLWSLPLYGWLMLVSSFATRLPLLWVVLLPAVVVFGERLLLGSGLSGSFITRHLEFAALPRLLQDADAQMPTVQGPADQLALLLSMDLWLGAAVGMLALAAAVWFYQRNNEL
jgi:ABC-2 type transport system permease protein